MQRNAGRSAPATGLRRLRVLGVAVAAGLVLSACGQAQPGVAASIDGETLSIQDVQERTAAFFDAYPEAASSGVTADQVSARVIENYLRAHIVDLTAADLGVEPTQTELQTWAEQYGGMDEFTRLVAGGGVAPDPDLVAVELRSAYLQYAIGRAITGVDERDETDPEKRQQLVDQIEIASRDATDTTAAAVDVSVNPRFGVWNGTMMTETNGSLSVVPGETPTAIPEDGSVPEPQG
jgi:hypothetical protein